MMMWDGGWSWAMLPMMLPVIAFWGAVIWLIVLLLRKDRTSGNWMREVEQVLVTRFASGEIDEREYQQRLTTLRKTSRDT